MNDTSFAATPPRGEEWRYAPVEGYWDEAVLRSGFPRRHWRQLVVAVRRMGLRQFDRSWHSGVRLMRETRVPGNGHTDPWDHERPLPFGPHPHGHGGKRMACD